MGRLEQEKRFNTAQQSLLQFRNHPLIAKKSLQEVADQVACYFPMQLRSLEMNKILTRPFEEIIGIFGSPNSSVGEVICLMERLLKELISDHVRNNSSANPPAPTRKSKESHTESADDSTSIRLASKYDEFKMAQQALHRVRIDSSISSRPLTELGAQFGCRVPARFGHLWLTTVLLMSIKNIVDTYKSKPTSVSDDIRMADIDDLIRLLKRLFDKLNPEASRRVSTLKSPASVLEVFDPQNQLTAVANFEDLSGQHKRFHLVQQALVALGANKAEIANSLENWGRKLGCRVPGRMRKTGLEEVLAWSFDELVERYESQRNSTTDVIRILDIDDLIVLLQRLLARIMAESSSDLARKGINAQKKDPTSASQKQSGSTSPVQNAANSEWKQLCNLISEHGGGNFLLGTIATSLQKLPITQWQLSLNNFIKCQLSDLTSYDSAALSVILDSIGRLARKLPRNKLHDSIYGRKSCPGPLHVITDWVNRISISGRIPDIEEVKEELIQPLVRQLIHDLSPRNAGTAIQRLGLTDPNSSSQSLSLVKKEFRSSVQGNSPKDLGKQVLRVRFPQAESSLERLYRHLQAAPGTDEQSDIVRSVAIDCFDLTSANFTRTKVSITSSTPSHPLTPVEKDETPVIPPHPPEEPSRIFAASMNHAGHILIRYAFGRILNRIPDYRPWSLVELGLTENDFNWLKAMFESLGPAQIRLHRELPNQFEPYSRDAQVGAVLLLLETEVARRHATEGVLWAPIYKQIAWPADTARWLFVQGQPNARHRGMLEAAAKELGLRSAFGEDSAQEWYQSVFLQFGFSQKGFEKRLPEWLAGQNRPRSVERLLDDSRYSSKSFSSLWQAISDFRRGFARQTDLESAMRESPWVLPDWHDSLIRISREAAHKLDGSATKPASAIEQQSQGRFIQSPRLRLDGSVVDFTCRVELGSDVELLEDSYDIVISGRQLARLLRQSDGTYSSNPEEFSVPSVTGSLTAQLLDRSGEIVDTQDLVFWDPVEDVDAYVLRTGRPISPFGRQFTEVESLLIYSSDLRLEGTGSNLGLIGNGSRRVALLSPNTAKSAQLFLRDQLLWEPRSRVFPSWRDQVTAEVRLQLCESQSQFRIRITHPQDVVVTAIRFQGKLTDCRSVGSVLSETDLLPLDHAAWEAEQVRFTVLLKKGDERTDLRCEKPLKHEGNLWRQGEDWDVLSPQRVLEVDDFRNARFRLSTPKSVIDGVDWHLFEGQRWIAPIREKAQKFTDVEGWGAPLTLRTGPYNSCQDEHPVIRGIINQGLIRGVTFQDDQSITIDLRRAVEPDSSHSVVLLGDRGEIYWVSGAELEYQFSQSDNSICCWILKAAAIESLGATLVALGIAYDGSRLGSWWTRDWSRVLSPRIDKLGFSIQNWARDLAEAVRWFHLPLLNGEVAVHVKEFASRFPVEVLTAWLGPSSSNHFAQNTIDNAWANVVGAIFADWHPQESESNLLDQSLESALSDRKQVPLKVSLCALTASNPLLAARFAQTRLRALNSEQENVREAKALTGFLSQDVLNGESEDQLIQRVALDVAGANRLGEGTFDFVRDGLLEPAIQMFDRGSQEVGEYRDRRNVEIAMRLDAFRRLVLVKCLDRISKELV